MKTSRPKHLSVSMLCATFAFLFLVISGYSQTETGWKLFAEAEGIKIFTQKVIIIPSGSSQEVEYLIFRFQNTTQKEAVITYKLDVWYGNNCRSCSLPSPNEYELSLQLKAGQTLIGNPGDLPKTASIISKMINPDQDEPGITRLEFNNLNVQLR